MEKFAENKKYMETEVNEIIKEFYEDFSTIRRELINFGYMQRDVYTSEYWVLKKELTSEQLDKIGARQKKLKEEGAF